MNTYRNAFHGTEAQCKYTRTEFKQVEKRCSTGQNLTYGERLIKASGNRLKDRLCGSAHCTCSNWYGERI